MNANRLLRLVGTIFVLGLTVGLLAVPAAAQTYTWDPNGNLTDGGGTWTSSAGTMNWYNGSMDVAWPNTTAYTALFGSGSGTAGTVNVSGGVTAGGLTFNAPSSGTYLLSNGSITLGGAATITMNATSGTIGSVLAGTAGLTMAGTGTLELTGANTYTGATAVNAGTFQVDAGGVISNAGAINISGSAANNATLSIAGGSVATSGQMDIGGVASQPGAFTISSGTLRLTNGGTALVLGSNTSNNNATANASFTQTGGAVNITGNVFTGNSPTSSTMTINGGSFAASGTLYLGIVSGGSGSLTIGASGAPSVWLGALTLGYGAGSAGTLNMSGGSLSIAGEVIVGNNGPGIAMISGGTFADTANTFYVGVTAGTLTIGGSGSVSLNNLEAGYGGSASSNIINLNSGGTLKLFGATAGSDGATFNFNGGTLTAGAGFTSASNLTTVVQSGGAFINPNGFNITVPTALTNGGGGGGLTLTSAGTLTLTAANTFTGATTISAGTMTISGAGTLADTTLISVGAGTTLNLAGGSNVFQAGITNATAASNGGTLAVSGVIDVTNNTAQTLYPSTITLTGGTLTSESTNTTGFGAFYVGANRTIIASGAGNTISAVNIGIASGVTLTLNTPQASDALTSSTSFGLGGSGALAKSGSGTAVLTGSSTYTGATSVSAGALYLNGGALSTSSAISVAGTDGAAFGGNGSAGATTVQAGGTIQGGYNGIGALTLTSLSFSGASTVNVSPTNIAAIDVTNSNGLTTASGGTINIGTMSLGAGTYPLIEYAGTIQGAGSGAFTIGIKPTDSNFYSLQGVAGDIDLLVALNAPYWSGSNGTAWDTTTYNWGIGSATGTPSLYSNGLPVVFDDSAGTANGTVVISGTDVSPASVAFSNNVVAYTLQGTNAITGSTGLTKSGTGSLTIANTNSFTGAVNFNGGTIAVGSIAVGGQNSSLGSGTSLTFATGTLEYTGVDAAPTTDRAVTLNFGGGTFQVDNAGTMLTLSGSIGGIGGLTKSGPGGLMLSNEADSLAGLTVSGGTLDLGGMSYSTGGVTLTSGTIQHGALSGTSYAVQSGLISASLAGSGAGLTMTNSGLVTLSGSNTYGGATTVNGGTLQIASGGSIANAAAVNITGPAANNATLSIAGGTLATSGQMDIGGVASQPGAVTISSGALTLSGGGTPLVLGSNTSNNNTTSNASFTQTGGAVNVTGNVFMGNSATSNTMTINGGSFTASGTLYLGVVNGGSGALTIGAPGAPSVSLGGLYAGIFTGSAGTVNMNGGTLTASGLSEIGGQSTGGSGVWTQTGGAAIFNGEVILGNQGPGTATISGGTFADTANTFYLGVTGGTLTISGSGSVSLNQLGLGYTTNTSSILNLNAGGTLKLFSETIGTYPAGSTFNFNGGTLTAGAGFSSPSGISTVVQSGGAFINTNGFNLTIPTALANAGGGGGLTKLGAGTLTLSASSSYSGGTMINGGVLQLGNNSALGTGGLTVNGGTLDLNGTQPVFPTLSGGGVIGNSSTGGFAILNYDNSTSSSTFSGTIQDSVGGGTQTTGLYVGSGTLTLTGPNTYSRTTTVDGGGTLVAGAADTLSSSSDVTVNGTLDVTSAAQTVKSLTVEAGSSLNISYNNLLTSTNTATFSGGTLNLSGVSGLGEIMAYGAPAGSGFADVTGLPGGDRLAYNATQLDIVAAGPSVWAAGSANWSSSASWTGGVPNAAAAGAAFNQTSGGTTTVTLDSPQTVGTIALGDTGSSSTPVSYLLLSSVGSNTLTLNNSGSGAAIAVNNGSHEIDAALVLADSGGLTVTGSGSLAFGSSSSITDNGAGYALTMNGVGGTLILSGSDNYTGGTTVEAGTLVLASGNALAPGSGLTVEAGSVLLLDPGLAVAGPVNLSAGPVSVAAVPEPGTLALLMAGVVAGFGVWRRRKIANCKLQIEN